MMQEILKGMVPQLVSIVVPLVIIPLVLRFLPVILPATGHAFNWVKKKAETVDNDFAQGVLVRLTKLVQATVLSFEATRIQSLKEMLADGTITKEELQTELEELKIDAISHVKNLISGQGIWDKAMYVFSGSEGELSRWIDTQIEATVFDLPPSGLQTSEDGVTPPVVELVDAEDAPADEPEKVG